MMNFSNSGESYYPPIMPFFSIEGSNQQNIKDHHHHHQDFVDHDHLMNRPIISSSDQPCYPSIMPFFGIEESSKQATEATISSSFLTNTQNTYHRSSQFNSYLDYSAPLVALNNNNNRYSTNSTGITEYHSGLLMRPTMDDRFSYGATTSSTPLGLNLSYNHSYFSSPTTSSFSRLLWRSRGGYFFGHQPPRCQAEGCKADLSNAKRYHRRHKVCEFHSKATVVTVSGGLQQRFCQQCSRFHSLDEFDEAKKSCRKRLADHNRRRRKPQQSSSTVSQTTNNSANKKKQAADINASQPRSSKCSTSNTAWNNSSSDKKNCDKDQKHKTKLKIGSSLSLGGTGKQDIGYMSSSDHNQLHHHKTAQFFSSDNQLHLDSYRSNDVYSDHFNQQNLSCSSSSAILQSIGDVCELPHHVGQAMFELDFA